MSLSKQNKSNSGQPVVQNPKPEVKTKPPVFFGTVGILIPF
jgi:hypothetical protein